MQILRIQRKLSEFTITKKDSGMYILPECIPGISIYIANGSKFSYK